MVPSFRKFIGMVSLVLFVVTYAVVAMVIGDMTLQEAGTGIRLVYFGIAGLLWIFPAGAIIWWMEKSGRQQA